VRVFKADIAEAAGAKRRIRVPIRSHSGSVGGRAASINSGRTMAKVLLYLLRAAVCVAALGIGPSPVIAQSGNVAPPGKQKSAADTAKEGQKSIDEIAEASRLLTGPAGNPECVWLGRRVVTLLWRDDLDTAFRHLDLYDRFGCPSSHIQATFRCLVRQGNIDPKAPESLNGRVHACWLNPALAPTPASAAAKPPSGTSGGTTPR
jgi:hypothetical protein